MTVQAIYDRAKEVLDHLANTDVAVLAAGTKTSLGQTVEDWSAPTTVATLKGIISPAGKTTLERAGLLGQQDLLAVTMQRYDLNLGKHRLKIDNVTYEIVNANVVPSHTTAVVRRLS